MDKNNTEKKAEVLVHLTLAMNAITKNITEIAQEEIMEAIKALNQID